MTYTSYRINLTLNKAGLEMIQDIYGTRAKFSRTAAGTPLLTFTDKQGYQKVHQTRSSGGIILGRKGLEEAGLKIGRRYELVPMSGSEHTFRLKLLNKSSSRVRFDYPVLTVGADFTLVRYNRTTSSNQAIAA